MLHYAPPWKQVASLWPAIARRERYSVDRFTREIVDRMHPRPLILGTSYLEPDPRFVLVANHYQRRGMWILHPASAITQAIREHYGLADPPVRWLVTANWPRWRLGSLSIQSPGDLLLPRVAYALWCYPVSFAGTQPARTATTVRQLLRELPSMNAPVGIFPEGVAGSASRLSPPLPGVDRLLALLAKAGLPVQPVGISETDRLVLRFGPVIPPGTLLKVSNPAEVALQRVADLL